MNNKEIQIRETGNPDLPNIFKVEHQAFAYAKEAELTAALLKDETAKPLLSLLAFHGSQAVGHILFTRVYIENRDEDQALVHILAPLAVIPEFQKMGIGGMLINEGLKILQERGSQMVFVLGHMEYYPKYGFVPDAKNLGYEAPYPIPDEFANAWMVQSLNPAGFVVKKGKVLCADALDREEHWRE
ncbi:GNAT family N-acetyltransferase [Bacteroidota bacterium]